MSREELAYIYELLHDDVKARHMMISINPPQDDKYMESMRGLETSQRLIGKIETILVETEDDDEDEDIGGIPGRPGLN